MSADIEVMKKIVQTFHDAIIKAKPDLRFPYNDFPFGCCQDTSWILQRYLIELGYKNLEVVGGTDCSSLIHQSHAWLEWKKSIIIDLTYYQFGGVEKIFVTEDRSSHNRFDRETYRYEKPYWEVYKDTRTMYELDLYYDIVTKNIEHSHK
ncbi:hypothetical protein DNHGIG_00450 [Collibacillus ludicampi]|uniref:Uncharacterized protein n=1 Tax=Collibacillus ludicampi TaxID=2771369 RepID=A0AAV4L9N3_9BACL|nr:hypothetical protein [Collibacillus ludicampi]GIM44496.1 hypothetical protein DNHGIG_00450 [Collibacillus ludicampi]